MNITISILGVRHKFNPQGRAGIKPMIKEYKDYKPISSDKASVMSGINYRIAYFKSAIAL